MADGIGVKSAARGVSRLYVELAFPPTGLELLRQICCASSDGPLRWFDFALNLAAIQTVD